MTRNLAWLRKRLSRKLNFNVTQTDQDFAGPSSNANELLDEYLSEAYSREVTAAKIEISSRPFSQTASFTWAASTVTVQLPQYLVDQQMIRIEDTTDTSPGPVLWVGGDGGQSTMVFWKDRNTLQWGQTGPGSARTITAFYNASAVELTNPLDEPVLIPPDHRHLLVWSAACIARAEADEGAPAEWVRQHMECRSQYHAMLAKGVIAYPLSYFIQDPGAARSSEGASTTAGIGGGIG